MENNNFESCNNVDEDVSCQDITSDKNVGKMKSIISWAATILLAFLVFGIATIFVRPGVVNGRSMESNFYHGDRFFMVKDWLIDEYNYGDVVCVDIEGRILIKRIIGLPGDTIVIDNYKVYRNGEELDESEYISEDVKTLPYGFVNQFTVKDGEYFVLGDNRENSADSRMLGPVDTVMGKTWFFFKKSWFK
jgi:signal peptidase I